ncbi:hypothetical protein KAJ87_00345 [Candidatus Pacearchaeota archaeon]|nr:hypothetical protein [Candidatus Pacearchaeota archaeon]
MNKRGQFYLISAVIIIALIIVFAGVSNYLEKDEQTKLYDLKEDLEIESENVLAYGTYWAFDEAQMLNLLEGFIEAYSEYGEVQKIVFIFGNQDNITILGYQQLEQEIINIETGTGSYSLQIGGENATSETYENPGEDVIVIVGGSAYEFELRKGENFYFILAQEIEGEQYVVTG